MSKYTPAYFTGCAKNFAIWSANLHDDDERHAHSAGPISPYIHLRDKFSELIVSSVSSPALGGATKSPFSLTGITEYTSGRLYLLYVPALLPNAIVPLATSFHNTLLPLVYGAGPYLSSHQLGFAPKPNISHGVECGDTVSKYSR